MSNSNNNTKKNVSPQESNRFDASTNEVVKNTPPDDSDDDFDSEPYPSYDNNYKTKKQEYNTTNEYPNISQEMIDSIRNTVNEDLDILFFHDEFEYESDFEI